MSLSSISIKRPVLATVMSVVIVVFGVIGYKFLGVRDFPSVDPPIISVSTSYSGANADVIESQITEPLEKAINGVPGIRNISSTSSVGQSNITVEFNLDADLETAANDVRDKVGQAQRQLPQDINAPPVVTKADANADQIITLTVSSNTRNIMQVDDYAENVLQEGLQTIPGVSSINIQGQRQYAMRLWIDPNKISALGLTATDIGAALSKENVELPAGKIEGNNTELTIRALGKLTDEKDFNNLIIRSDSNRVVRLKDIGYAVLGSANEETAFKESGIPQVGLAVVPQPGANYVQIAKDFYVRLKQIEKDLPPDITVKVALDNTKFINNSIEEVKETLIISFVLVVIIIYLFFRDWLIAFRPLIDIPVSLIGAFFIMYVCGFSINILTLLGIVLATGLVVDDGIVVTENIYKKVEEGMDIRKAAFQGSAEILFAVISTSITLAAVFLPIMFLQGFTGRLFREFAVVVAGSVLISAFVSLSLTPMLNVKLIRKNQKKSKFYVATEPFFEKMTTGYTESLVKFMKRRWVSFVILGGSLIITGVLLKVTPSELAPLDDRSLLRYTVTGSEGATYEYMTRYMDKVANLVTDSIPEANVNIEIVSPSFGGGSANTGFGRIGLVAPDQRERTQQQLADWLNKKLSRMPDARAIVIQEQTISGGGSGARTSLPVQFVIQNQDFEKIRKVLPEFFAEVSKSPVFQGSDVNLKFTKPELRVTTDRDRARDLGVSVADIAQTLQLYYSAGRLDYFLINGKQYQVIAQVDRANRDQPLDLKSVYVRSSKGTLVQLDNVVKVSESATPPSIYHFNRFKSATLQAGLSPGHTIGDGIAEMNRIAKGLLDESFSTELAGPSRDYAEGSSNILFAFGFALLLIYLVLAAQFESFIDPFIVMLTVPLAIAGAFISLWLFDQTFNIFSQIGIITLVGLVTKNGILIVEFANQRMEHGLSKYEAVVEAATSRLRPILMTSLAVVLGSVPIALALGAGAKSRVSLGIVIIGGMLFSLVLTLYVIPTMYMVFAAKTRRDPDDEPEDTTEPKTPLLIDKL
ncbi:MULTISPECIES: efflux RND transporter permease subunit [unclassified Mucilaginibacter]|uniref:efflux RND transporter permease subunit n=1 Tax=unclassified Mucilaginibacter TaxID=2617802 RepID=UPI00095EA37A|nr:MULTISPECIES: efflux RND transporter permease subunit [unclassified Mucilaginibacter]OJW16518.1 MAG: acriflavin resistance protein [Mucilaginibacter sp. 44-25]PLW90564.1 MAG: acriflavin resistance protein [Mucilaginibacter sp.]PMP65116.1 MAG: acriflavin resistance protein [Mucilaginibacter sp.]HEK20018.1 efflux RND transporter permease subunit [Bacteroidota bacterium]